MFHIVSQFPQGIVVEGIDAKSRDDARASCACDVQYGAIWSYAFEDGVFVGGSHAPGTDINTVMLYVSKARAELFFRLGL